MYIKVFPITLRRKTLKTYNNHWSFWICFLKLHQESHMVIVTPYFSQSSVLKMFSVHTKTKSRRFQISSGLKSGFENFRFHEGQVWTVGLTVETKLRLQAKTTRRPRV